MAYKGFRELLSICFIAPKNIWSSSQESFKTSKLTFFFQVINFSFLIYICTVVIPKMIANYETLVSFLKQLEAPYVMSLLLFIYFVFWIFSGVKSLGFQILFETNRAVTISITLFCFLILCLDKFLYEEIKSFTKRIFKYDPQ